MIRRLLTLSAGLSLLVGCASQSQWTPTVDTYGNSRAQYLTRDLEECRALATRTSGYAPEEAARGAAIGGLAGAAGGAAIGALLGRPGRGAALGAVTGGIGLGAARGAQSEAQFKRAFNNCMRGRGHNVID